MSTRDLVDITTYIDQVLQRRKIENGYRRLKFKDDQFVDFCSNDYLGFARSKVLRQRIEAAWQALPESEKLQGATGSRLLSGQYPLIEQVEQEIAQFHQAEAALIFSSGYCANVGLFPTLCRKDHTILYDELSHASTIDGCRLAPAKAIPFRHNDPEDLKAKLVACTGRVWVSVESVYSMDGDLADLLPILALCETYNAQLIVDEAHATGVIGDRGQGLCQALGVHNKVFARIHTFSKALGGDGAAIIGSKQLREYLINYCRSFIYTTAPPPWKVLSIKKAYELLQQYEPIIESLDYKIALFRSLLSDVKEVALLDSHSPIQGVVMESAEATKALSLHLNKLGFDVRPILPPTVEKGRSRVRICIHAFNTEEELVALANGIKKYEYS